jgi:hypothetical protein
MTKLQGPKLSKEYDEETRVMFNELVELGDENNYHEHYTTSDIKRMIGWLLRRRPDNFAKLDNMRFLYKTYQMCDMEEGLQQRLHDKHEKMLANKKVRFNVFEDEEEEKEEEEEEDGDSVSCTMSEAEEGEFENFDEAMHDYHNTAKYCTFGEMRGYLRHIIGNPGPGDESEYDSEEEELTHEKGVVIKE